jgi:predicted ATPase
VGADLEASTFVGRRGELEILTRHLDRAIHGFPSVVIVEGGAGEGKTALIERFVRQVDGVVVVRASGDALETHIAYGLLDQLLSGLIPASSHPDRPRKGEEPAPARDLLSTGEALLNQLVGLSAAPVHLLVIDDAHLADRASLGALNYALRRLKSQHVMTIVATHPNAEARLPAGLLKLAEASGARLPLAGLSIQDVRALAVALGLDNANDRAARRLREHTRGTPLHLHAVIREMRAFHGEWSSEPLPLPQSFSALVRAQLSQLPDDAQQLASAAAVLGHRSALHDAATLIALQEPLPAAEQLHTAGLLKLFMTEATSPCSSPTP